MEALEIARRLTQLGEAEKACPAYILALQEGGLSPAEELEAAFHLLHAGGDYKVAYTCFCSLYNRGLFRDECLSAMRQAFYEPNVKRIKARYDKNCRLLNRYPYLFRHDFPAFDELPIQFYPFDDTGYLPFHSAEGRFGDYTNFRKRVISRNFFQNLDDPVLAHDVYSQYELEYLNDTVRASEDVGRENHVYLHYSDWGEFCSHLQVLNFRPLLESKKLVFLIGDELEQYPIDFKARFHIDYSTYPVRPFRIREIHRLIWNMQLSSHNGGNFFNEIFDGHPNLIATPSLMLENIEKIVDKLRDTVTETEKAERVDMSQLSPDMAQLVKELCGLADRTDKDLLVAGLLADNRFSRHLDPAARIAPAMFLQPHFGSIVYRMHVDRRGRTVLSSEEYDAIRSSPVFQNFRYVKTFTPMRRITTGYGAAIRYMQKKVDSYQAERAKESSEDDTVPVVGNELINRLTNRSFMADPEDRLCMDSVVVRFEDAKLNPKATFKALAAFLDLPYTSSLTYCSMLGKRDPESLKGDEVGFSTAAVYREYNEYANDAERAFIEYFMRDAYAVYGYDFHFYDGREVDEKQVNRWISNFTTAERYICDAWKKNVFTPENVEIRGTEISAEKMEQALDIALDRYRQALIENWHTAAQVLLRSLRFVNRHGQPLRMIDKLELDPNLLEQDLYH